MAEKAFDEVHLFMIKTFKLDRGGDCINISMAICGESAVNIILSGERAKAFKRRTYLLLSLLFNIVLEVLVRAVKHEKEIKTFKSERKK